MSLRAKILDSDDLPKERVSEWGETFYVRGLSGLERDDWEQECIADKGKDGQYRNVRARLLVRCIVDENGARVFSDADAASLGKKSGRKLQRLYELAEKLSGIGVSEDENGEQVTALESAKKN